MPLKRRSDSTMTEQHKTNPAHTGGAFLLPCIDTVQGFYFALLQYSHIQAFTARFVQSMQLYCQHSKTAHKALQGHSVRFDRFHRQQYQTGTSGYNTTCATLERITAPQHLQRIPDTRRHAGTLHSSAQPPIIIRYIRARGVFVIDPCRAV